jgi:hypothetical protein
MGWSTLSIGVRSVFVQSLQAVLEEGLAARNQVKNLSGNVRDIGELLRPETMELLADKISMVAFLAFNPVTDRLLVDYVRSGGLASDSGPNLLVLFNLDRPVTRPLRLGTDAFSSALQIESATHPSYEIVRLLFEPKVVPPLPGIAFLATGSERQSAVFIQLDDLADAEALKQQVRRLFSFADAAARSSAGAKGVDKLSVMLRADRIAHVRPGRTSLQEWLVRTYQFLGDNFASLVSVVSLL